ncbi:hypothetical protein FACS1894113_3770 [Alphaproteobacteria bacterium]|nr:hypothetical protein FACS1894113_3770 [Alphaproteobacteria bacterium]
MFDSSLFSKWLIKHLNNDDSTVVEACAYLLFLHVGNIVDAVLTNDLKQLEYSIKNSMLPAGLKFNLLECIESFSLLVPESESTRLHNSVRSRFTQLNSDENPEPATR